MADSRIAERGVDTPYWIPPQTDLILDADPDYIGDADGATITTWVNNGSGGDLESVVGTPTVHDNVYNGHRVMRMVAGDEYCIFPATTHPNQASVYSVAIFDSTSNLTRGVVCLYQSASERNAFFYRHTSTAHRQGFWNNETSWLHAASVLPLMNEDILYTRGWVVETNGGTEVNLRYYGKDGGTPLEEIEDSQTPNGMEEFNKYHVGWGGSSTSDWSGDIVRVLVYDALHSAITAAAIVSHLRTEYGST